VLRYCTLIALFLCLCARSIAETAPADDYDPADSSALSHSFAPSEDGAPASLDEYSPHSEADDCPTDATPSEAFFSKLRWLGFKHSSYSGRNAGRGVPLVGTSWLNRPYYVGADIGTVWVTKPVEEGITRDIDTFGGLYAGYDCDYYWGTELAVQRATPELKNEDARNANRGDRRMYWSANLLYYPWGDSLFRPYWRTGLGATEIDYPMDSGERRDEALWAVPIGIGLKYPFRRWLAVRAEFVDQIGLGNSGIATQHDLTLTFALEWRLGARPRSYWPWNPSRQIW
jgi:hypothetical protein